MPRKVGCCTMCLQTPCVCEQSEIVEDPLDAADLLRRAEACGVKVEDYEAWPDYMENAITVAVLEELRQATDDLDAGWWRDNDKPLPLAAIEALERAKGVTR